LPKVVIIGKKKFIKSDINLLKNFYKNNYLLNKYNKVKYNLFYQELYKNNIIKSNIKFADSLSVLFKKYHNPDNMLKYLKIIINYLPSYRGYIVFGNNFYNKFSFKINNKSKKIGIKIREYYNKVLLKYKNNVDIKAKMSITYINTKNPMKGIVSLKKILKYNSLHKIALINIGLLSMKSGQYEKAIKRFKKLKKEYPFDMKSRIYLALSYIAINKNILAKKDLIFIKNNGNSLMKLLANNYLNNLK